MWSRVANFQRNYGQFLRWLAKGDSVGQAHFIAELFGIAA